MKRYKRLAVFILFAYLILCAGVNIYIYKYYNTMDMYKYYKIDENRIINKIKEQKGQLPKLSPYKYIKDVEIYKVYNQEKGEKGLESYFNTKNDNVDYQVVVIDGQAHIIKFCYLADRSQELNRIMPILNGILLIAFILLITIFFYIGINIVKPFHSISNLPEELSKGTLTKGIPESRNRYFGKFTWGLDLLRQKLESQKAKELELEREKKMLIISISHDIKTPLSVIKLYTKALKDNLYDSEEKKVEVLESIRLNSEEIEHFVGELIKSSTTDILKIEVEEKGEFYLKDLIKNIEDYYSESMKLKCIDFKISSYGNCLLRGDMNRTIEVLQNVIENAVKYGDGKEIRIDFNSEEDCKLITVSNSGNTLPDIELVHIFESFYRGSNVKDRKGNGIGLYICKEIMKQMNGEIFAESKDGWMAITLVIPM